jgi:hypothetical protein
MNIKFHYSILLAAFCIGLVSCKKDNYDEPTSKLTGRLVYKGESIGVERNQVPYELYQFGFGKVGPIGSSFDQDGKFSALLFDGEYKLIIPNGQGPFMWKKTASGAPDTTTITLRGSQTLDLEVTPYYMIRSPQITGGGGKVTANFKVEKIITDANAKNIENVSLYINKTQFVSQSGEDRIAQPVTIAGSAITDPNNISLQITVPNIQPVQNYVFARIGLKIQGVEDRIYSPVVKVQF